MLNGCDMRDYYALPKNQQWLPSGDNPHQIGGVITEFTMVVDFLANNIEYQFQRKGGIPIHLVIAIQATQFVVELAEDMVQWLILEVAEEFDDA